MILNFTPCFAATGRSARKGITEAGAVAECGCPPRTNSGPSIVPYWMRERLCGRNTLIESLSLGGEGRGRREINGRRGSVNKLTGSAKDGFIPIEAHELRPQEA
jgi:hypothetical protein